MVDFLLDSFKQENWDFIFANYDFFIRRGEPGTEEIIIRTLNQYWDKVIFYDDINDMAMAMYKCGNKQLSEAGRIWMENHGIRYELKKNYSGPKWGQGD